MKRQITGLHAADRCAADQIPDGVFLVRVQRVQFRRQAQKPYYTLNLAILEPSRFSGHVLSSRLYCSPKALWKLNWFLRDFGYDTELLGRDEVDETQLVGLKGVIKISHIVCNGASLLRLDGFAAAGRWEELSPANLKTTLVSISINNQENDVIVESDTSTKPAPGLVFGQGESYRRYQKPRKDWPCRFRANDVRKV